MAKIQFKARPATDAIFVHCSATKACMDIGVREISQWHREQGWLAIGYHFVIRRDGRLETGRPIDAVGSHVQGWNERSIGICLVGGIDDSGKFKANFTPIQMSNLKNLLANLKQDYPEASVKAHHDVAPKACPSFDLQRWLKTGELVTSDRG